MNSEFFKCDVNVYEAFTICIQRNVRSLKELKSKSELVDSALDISSVWRESLKSLKCRFHLVQIMSMEFYSNLST